jgi:hypothetical protein
MREAYPLFVVGEETRPSKKGTPFFSYTKVSVWSSLFRSILDRCSFFEFTLSVKEHCLFLNVKGNTNKLI